MTTEFKQQYEALKPEAKKRMNKVASGGFNATLWVCGILGFIFVLSMMNDSATPQQFEAGEINNEAQIENLEAQKLEIEEEIESLKDQAPRN